MNQLDRLLPKLQGRERRARQRKEGAFLDQFEEVYRLAKEVSREQAQADRHLQRLRGLMERLEVHAPLVLELRDCVARESRAGQTLRELEELSRRVGLGGSECAALAAGDLRSADEAAALETFSKILRKIEIFEALKEVETLRESQEGEGRRSPPDAVHISSAVAGEAGSARGGEAQSGGVFSSLWNLGRFLKADRVG